MTNEHALTTWRKRKNRSQKDVATDLGISRWMVNRIETGTRRPSWTLAAKISEYTNGEVTANDFAGRAQQ